MADFRVRVFETAIDSYFWAGRPVFNEANRLATRITTEAIRTAPVRSGELKSKHRKENALYSGKFYVRAGVKNTAPHARWVHEGTYGPILPKNGKALSIPYSAFFVRYPSAPFSEDYDALPTKAVRGQRANPWIADAARRVIATY